MFVGEQGADDIIIEVHDTKWWQKNVEVGILSSTFTRVHPEHAPLSSINTPCPEWLASDSWLSAMVELAMVVITQMRGRRCAGQNGGESLRVEKAPKDGGQEEAAAREQSRWQARLGDVMGLLPWIR